MNTHAKRHNRPAAQVSRPLAALLVFWTGPWAGPPPQRIPGESAGAQAVARVEAEWTGAYFKHYPWLAVERGRPGALEVGLGNLGSRDTRRWSDKVTRLQRNLERLGRSAFGSASLADAQALRAGLAVERILIDARSPERWNADSHVGKVERMFLALWFTSGEDDRRDAALQRLCVELPDYWNRARASLVSRRDEWTTVALARLDDLDRMLRDEVGRAWAATGSTERREERGTLLAAALESNAGFRTWLKTPHARAGGAITRLGEQRWLRLIQAASGTSWSTQEIRWRVLQDLASAERKHGPRWRDRDARRPATRSPEHDLDHKVSGLRASGHMTAAWTKSAGLTGIPPMGEQELRVIPNGLPPRRGADARLIGRPGRGEALLLATGTLEELDEAGLVVLGIRYGPLGLALSRGAASATASGLEHDSPAGAKERAERFGRGNRALEEGWGLLALDWVLESGAGISPWNGEEKILAEAAWIRVLEGARLLAGLELHALDHSREEALEGFQRRTGLPHDEAAFEVQAALIDPQRGIGYLGWRELQALESFLSGSSSTCVNARQKIINLSSSYPYRRPTDLRMGLGSLPPG